jgi:hypothetical protein
MGLLPSPAEFSSHCHFYKLFCSWLLGVCCCSCLLWPACEGFPLPRLWCSKHSTHFAMWHFLLLLLIIQFFFLFSPGVGRSIQGAMLIWPRVVCGSSMYHLAHLWSTSSQTVWVLPSGGGVGDLLVSPFNMKWWCYVQAGGVEESKFCLFWAVFPVRCISSISPRFYFRKHAFCFLPLATILESPDMLFYVTCLFPPWRLSHPGNLQQRMWLKLPFF